MKSFVIFFVALFFIFSLHASECGWCTELSLDEFAQHKPTDLRLSWSKGEAETNKIDVLFAFDVPARAWLVGYGFSEADFVDEVMREMNTSLALTGISDSFTFRNAGTFDIDVDLSSWRITTVCLCASGKMKKELFETYFIPMRGFRDEVAADIVVLLTAPQDTSTYGATLALTSEYFSTTGMATYAEYAYSVVDIRTTFSRYTILHEIGHIFGAGHSNKQSSSPGPQLRSYSSGYLFSIGEKNYATIMGYVQIDSEGIYHRERLPFFSSPDYSLDGVPVGTQDKNDNTRTLRETYPLVANFRVKTYLPGYRPTEDDVPESVSEDISLVVRDSNGNAIDNGSTISLRQFENIALPVNAECWTGEKVTIKAKGLPSGLKYSSKNGVISGRPKKAGTFAVSVAAKAKGMAENVCTFTVSVSALPDAVIGSYAGIMSSPSKGDALATAVVHKTGRIVVKFNFEGRTRTFSCQGFSGGGKNTWVAEPAARIGKATHTLNMVFDSTSRSVSFDDYSGMLLQNTWGRKDIVAPVFKKAIKQDVGDLKMRLYGKGKVRISGVIDGIRVSDTFQLVAGTPSGGYQKDMWSLPVAFPAKRNFQGWANWFAVELMVDASNRVSDGNVETASDVLDK
ncbi:MAG: putative Ig domain-containing protein [Kiritimatiellae bacterium]|nr:putative Ig domain-containing protein [Kiritimatiellia bacterium]